MKHSFFLLLLLGLVVGACSTGADEMTEIEQFLADKFQAERISVDFKQVQTHSIGTSEESRQYLSIEVENTPDMEKILADQEYTRERALIIGNFLLDSMEIEAPPFPVKELQIDFIRMEGVFIFHQEARKTISFDID